MIEVLPVFNGRANIRYTEVIVLENNEYILEVDWNDREEFRYLSIFNMDGSAVRGLLGIKAVVNWPLNRMVSDIDFPKGILFIINETNLDPGIDNLKLMYVDEEEWNQIQDG